MSTSNAGPSSAVTQEVHLSIEPVHIYTDSNLPSPPTAGGINTALGSSSISSVLNAFDRERKLQDILPDGTNVFADRQPALVQLSEDVRRLWAERGDFSRFRTEDLLKKRARDEDAAVDSGDSSDDDDEDEPGKKEKDDKDGEEGLLRPAGERVGGTIAESQFIELRNKVLSNLDVAHFNSIHAHQLLGMLIKQHRSTIQPSSNANVAARMGSPAPSVGGQSARSGSTTTAAATSNIPPKAPLGIFSHLNQPSSNREEEFILDPLSISLSRTSLNASTATRRTLGEEGGDEEEDEDDEYDHDPTSASFGLKQAKREMESTDGFKENKLREFKVVLETKRKAIGNAAELLSSAAEELRGSHAANRERWRGLIGLHGRGWGLTPGRPLLDVERFGVSTAEEEEEDVQPDTDKAAQQGGDGKEEVEKKTNLKSKEGTEKKAAGLQGFGTPIITSDGKVKEEGARDAWIGFGLPEAPIELRRRSIAYWADLPSSSNASEEEVKQKLVFPDRMHRRLRVRFVLWPATTASGGEGEGRIEWSSDPITGNVDGGKKEADFVVGQILDNELQAASREASDELVFGDVVAQARLLPPTFGVRLTSSSVRIVLTKRLDLVVELVPTTTTSSASEESQSQLKYAPHASLLLAFLRLSPLRQYQSFVKATSLGRQSDAAARAAAIKAVALAVPKKSTAAGGGKDSTADVGGGKGIAAGGKASSAALAKLDSLGPVIVGLHYWSFVHRLGSLLENLQKTAAKSGVRVKVQLVPITPSSASASASTVKRSKNLTDLTALLAKLVDATPSKRYFSASTQETRLSRDSTAIHTIYQTYSTKQSKEEPMDALKGFAKVFVNTIKADHQRLVCTLSFRQPSLITVQFATPNRNADSSGGGGGVGGAKCGVRLTNKPLAVDLETLATLLGQRIGLYTS
ncbi:uncharacterized protein UTRI_05567 [Ustilago trichophora]|uniref:Mediator of RNA polymerase II transcription subunit 17 n=1 Tax=Ustilago trichophora TaxID=86804 RepID=A0A5C3EI39_9BASI|nr:uncharacterized protein UTRI_05567 [Ustilago trichophora]